MKRETMLSLLLIGCSSCVASAATDVRGVLRPTSDAVVYFNTRQAEKAMSPEIWKRIKSEKEETARRARSSTGGKPFKNTDAEGALNVTFASFQPLQLTVDGEIALSGGQKGAVRQDVEVICSDAVEIGFSVTRGGSKDEPAYVLNGKLQEDQPPVHAELTIKKDGRIAGDLKWGGQQDKVSEGNRMPVLIRQMQSFGNDLSLGVALDAQRIATLPLDGNDRQRELKKLLVKLETLGLCVRVKGDALCFFLTGEFLREEDAVAFLASVRPFCSALVAALSVNGGAVRSMTPGGAGRRVTIMITADVSVLWQLLGRFERKK